MVYVWKACSRQNWLAGSNPVLSAGNDKISKLQSFTHTFTHSLRNVCSFNVFPLN